MTSERDPRASLDRTAGHELECAIQIPGGECSCSRRAALVAECARRWLLADTEGALEAYGLLLGGPTPEDEDPDGILQARRIARLSELVAAELQRQEDELS
jgi:hypothetical protein